MLRALSLRRSSPFVKDIFITSLSTVVVGIFNIFLIRIISKGLGPENLGIYTLVQRTVATWLPFTSLSIGIGLARYIALYTGKGQKTESILPAAVILSSICSLLVCVALFPFSRLLSNFIFNEEGKEIFFKLILFLLFGQNLYDCLYSYYRGQQRMFNANVWNTIVRGILPVFIAILFINTNNLSHIIFWIGLLSYASLFSLVPVFGHGIQETSWEEFKTIARKLLTYSIPRAPGGLALTLIFTFGVLVSPYVGGITNAAYMSIGIWIFQILQTATTAFGLVVLPKAANLLGNGNEDYLINKLRSIYDLILHIGLFTLIQLFIVIDFLIFIWLGPEYSEAVPIARIIAVSMIPFFYYTMMRNIIDAVEKRAINAFNVYLCLFITVITSLLLIKLGLGLSALAIGLDAGLILLGILTYFFMDRRYHVRLLPDNFFPVLIINIVMGLFICFVKYGMMANRFSYQNCAVTVLLQLLCGVIYIVILKKSGSTWIRDIEQRIVLNE